MGDLLQGVAVKDDAATTSKGERTRQRILEVALDLFKKEGYERTTMRVIARQAGVSVGNAYYYFKSKEHLIQAFYGRMHQEQMVAAADLLRDEKDFKTRLHGVIRCHIDIAQPYQQFASVLFRTAADPNSPLNPFSNASRPVRRESTQLFEEVIAGSDSRFPAVLEDELPELLWLYQMGIVLFWIFDRSPQCRRTYRLLDHTVDLVVRLIQISKLPPLRPLVRSATGFLAELRQDHETEADQAAEAVEGSASPPAS